MNLRAWVVAALAIGFCRTFATFAAAPPGWTIAGNAPTDYTFALDTTAAASGKRSALITAKSRARPDGFGMLWQIIAADNYRGRRLRLSGYLRTQAASRAQMWMRVDGPDGKTLAFDNMDSRPVTGTTGWRQYDIVLDVPSDSVDIAFGFLLISTGKVWGDEFKLEKVDSTVPVTSAAPALARAPTNMDFEDTGSTQNAIWTPRKLHFASGVVEDCDGLADVTRFVLLQLGARPSDLHINEAACYATYPVPESIDVTFSVLTPVEGLSQNVQSEVVQARWQAVSLKTDALLKAENTAIASHFFIPCTLLEKARKEILPLFPAKNVQPISRSDCFKSHVGLSAELLESTQAPPLGSRMAN
ncbi:MAG: hypothetical protein ACREUT_19575 [Steroidobacteraceae bacterium]